MSGVLKMEWFALSLCAMVLFASATPSAESIPSQESDVPVAVATVPDDGSTTFLIQIIVAVIVGLLGVFFLCCRSGKKKFKGDAIFLVGPCDSGKTALFFRLRDGLEDGKLRATHTSMTQNEATFVVHDDANQEETPPKPIRLIDFPGHRRLRPVLFANLEDCCGVIFVVDASNFTTQAREIAELILDLLTSTALLKNGRKMLILCNKADSMPDDFAGIEPKKMVRKRLETEVESLRVSRASALGETDASAVRVQLEIAGTAFRWSDSPLDVDFLDFSAKAGDGIDKLREWLLHVRD